MKIAVVQGTRPEIIKNYSIVRALEHQRVPHAVFHTNQHALPEMRDRFYEQMGYGATEIMAGPYRLGGAIDWLQDQFVRHSVTHVLVNGDTAASLAGALAAMYRHLPVAHVEAGLRSRDPFMFEERNRIMVDAVATQLFAYTEHECELLNNSPDVRGAVYVEGNTTVDVIHDFSGQIGSRPIAEPYAFATMHRQEFTHSEERMRRVFETLSEISRSHCPVVLPLHPRTRDAIERTGIEDCLRHIWVIPPVDALRSLAYQKHAAVVLTDSGCIQEEAYMLGTPCVTIRENTERHLTVKHGANRVTGFESGAIKTAFFSAVGTSDAQWPEIYGARGVGGRIVERIAGGHGTMGFTACASDGQRPDRARVEG